MCYSIIVLSLSYVGFIATQRSFKEKEEIRSNSKYSKNKLSPGLLKDYYHKLVTLVENEQLYLNPQFTIQELSSISSIPQVSISQVLNTYYDKGFYDFINQYRISHAKKLLGDQQEAANKTIAELAFESGFNTKSTFYKVFRTSEGVTPSEYIDQCRRISGLVAEV